MGPLIKLDLYSSQAIVPVATFTAGKYLFQTATYSNSLLSTIWVKQLDIGATVLARWYDIGPGSGTFPGEKIYISAHKLISTSDYSDRRLVAGIHNKAFLEVEVTGGEATFGVYMTAVSSFPTEYPFKDSQDALLTTDAGGAVTILDPTDNKWYFLRGPQGAMNSYVVGGNINADFIGDTLQFIQRTQTTPNVYQTLIDQTVTADKIWKLRQAVVICRAYGEYQISADGVIIGEGKTSQTETNSRFDWKPYSKQTENINIKLDFRQNFGPAQDVAGYLQLTEEDA